MLITGEWEISRDKTAQILRGGVEIPAIEAFVGTIKIAEGNSLKEEKIVKTLEEVMASLSPERRAKAQARGRELIQEELMLDALRRYLLTGEEGLGVEHRAALEQCPDMLISTMRGHVESLGGKLEVLACFPGEKSISLSDFE